MNTHTGNNDDRRIELIVGNILRIGVVLSAAIVLLGGIIYVSRQEGGRAAYGTFRGEPVAMTSMKGIVSHVPELRGRDIIQLGLLLLIATPVVRVVFSAFAFAAERDWLYVLVTLIVLGVLGFSLLG